jgi:hypothetical protein
VRVERVLVAVGEHPLRHERAAARDDAGHPPRRERDEVAQEPGVDRHVVDALRRLRLDDLEEPGRGEVLHLLHVRQALVDRHRADRQRAVPEDRLPDLRDVTAGREIHHRVGAVLEADPQLLQLLLAVADHRAVADVRVDLAFRGEADGHRLQLRVPDVGGDDHPAARDLVADPLHRQALARGDVGHLLRHGALTCVVQLRDVGVTPTLRDPFGAHDELLAVGRPKLLVTRREVNAARPSFRR